MVSRRSTQSVTQRSTRQSELHMTRRPRRLVAPKTVDDAVGLSRKEERELKKALYASLQESRRPRTPQLEEDSTASDDVPKLRKSTRTIVSPLSYPAGVRVRSHASSTNMDESSQDSVMSSVASSHESKKKVHAQRKFAQGCSLPSTPGTSPGKKAANSPHSLLDRVPKTEDFLTFLCLRGSHLLPANLDFFNFARDESSMEEGSSRPRTPVSAEQGGQSEQTRESTPESSSSGSNVNEELMEITTPLSTPIRLLQASRKAARASAGTPETARGIVSLRQGLTRKVVHTGATPPSQHSKKFYYTPEKTPSPSGSRLVLGEFTPAKKSASVKCLPASFLRFSPAGKLALERNGNSPRLTPYKTPAAPSPLHSSKVKDSDYQGQGQRQFSEVNKKNSACRSGQMIHSNQAKLAVKEFRCFPGDLEEACNSSVRTSEKAENTRQILKHSTGKTDIMSRKMEDCSLKNRKSTGSILPYTENIPDALTGQCCQDDRKISFKKPFPKKSLKTKVLQLKRKKHSLPDVFHGQIQLVSDADSWPHTRSKHSLSWTETLKKCYMPPVSYTRLHFGNHRSYKRTQGKHILENVCMKESRDVDAVALWFSKKADSISKESFSRLTSVPTVSLCNTAKLLCDFVANEEKTMLAEKAVACLCCNTDFFRSFNFHGKEVHKCKSKPSARKQNAAFTLSSDRSSYTALSNQPVNDTDNAGETSTRKYTENLSFKGTGTQSFVDGMVSSAVKEYYIRDAAESCEMSQEGNKQQHAQTAKNISQACEASSSESLKAQYSDHDEFVSVPTTAAMPISLLQSTPVSLGSDCLADSTDMPLKSVSGLSSWTEILKKCYMPPTSYTRSHFGSHRSYKRTQGKHNLENVCLKELRHVDAVAPWFSKNADSISKESFSRLTSVPTISLCNTAKLLCDFVANEGKTVSAKKALACVCCSTGDFFRSFNFHRKEVHKCKSKPSARKQNAAFTLSSDCSSHTALSNHDRKQDNSVVFTGLCNRVKSTVTADDDCNNSKDAGNDTHMYQSAEEIVIIPTTGLESIPNRARASYVPLPCPPPSCWSKAQPVDDRDSSERGAHDRPCTEICLWRPSQFSTGQPQVLSSHIYVSRISSNQVTDPHPVLACMCGHCHLDTHDNNIASKGMESCPPYQFSRAERPQVEAKNQPVNDADNADETSTRKYTENLSFKGTDTQTDTQSFMDGMVSSVVKEYYIRDAAESCEMSQEGNKQQHAQTAKNISQACEASSSESLKAQYSDHDEFVSVPTTAAMPISLLQSTPVSLGSDCLADSTDMPLKSVSGLSSNSVSDLIQSSVVTCASNESYIDSRSVTSGEPHGVGGGCRHTAPCLYPLPPALCSFSIESLFQRVPTGAFKPVEPAQSKLRREARTSSSSPVRRVLEGASKKLSRAQRPDTRGRTQKQEKSQNRSREDRAKNRNRTDTNKNRKEKRSKPAARKTAQATPKTPQIKPKRRSSMRLKTLAKILGRKRPNYSLVLSGYADMEEYEEEQKKKAAKSALAKAKAEARARASAKHAAATVKPKKLERMKTRSASATVRDPEWRKTDEKERTVLSIIKRSLSSSCTSRDTEEKRAIDRERTGSLMVKRSLSTSATNKDTDEKRDGTRAGNSTLKRSLSSSYVGKRDQPALATIIETKRLKKEGGKDAEEGRDSSRSRQSSVRESTRKPTSTTPHQAKRVTPKKPTPERAGTTTSPEPGLSHLEKVPTFYPSEEEFLDPVMYIESIQEKAEAFGMCRIIPPASWKMESKVNEEIRFTTQVQHLHRLFTRWGPIVEQTRAIVHHLRDAMTTLNSCTPQIGGVEVDLPQLYCMIRDLGGLQNIVDKKQWVKVADAMKIPKTAHDRVTRLYDVYCKFVLPYAMLSEAEREQAQKDVHMHYELSSAEEDAILKGKSMTLGTFSRIARNVQSMWFKEDPNPEMVEAAYWKIVEECKAHVSVQCAHVNTRTQSTAFPMRRESPYFRHSWNLNNLPDNKKCILKCLGPVSGTTIPTLHVGMLFSTSCWSTDPHRLPYVQYLHSGANTIWYCIPKNHGQKFHDAMKDLCPTLIHNEPMWLREDIAMVKPDALKSKGVRVARCVQQPRQFVVVFPDVYTATVCCGYNVSESVHYATTEWLSVGMDAAKVLCSSGEKELFSVDTLVCGLCQDSTDLDTLNAALPMLQSIVARELEERRQLSQAGLKCERRLAVEDSPGTSASLARKRSHDLTEDSACEVCYRICYLSMVLNEHDEQILCLEHGLRYVQRKRHVKAAKLFYRYTEEELTELVQATKERVASLTAGASGMGGTKKRTLKKQDSKS